MPNQSSQPHLGLLALVMMAIISVSSLRNLPIAAQYGAPLVFFYAVAGFGFLLPLAWVTGKLSIYYPGAGGAYLWIREAFGHRVGQFAIGLQWVYNMIWYPTLFAFITATLAVLLGHHFDQSQPFVCVMSLLLFWLLTWVHCFGLRFSNWISIGSAVFGTLVPMAMIIGLAVFWVVSGKKMATPLGDWHAWIPTVHDFKNIGFFSNILFSLLGLEVIAVYAGLVENPNHTYPKALIISASVILLTLIGSSLALCVIVPADKIAIITGLVDVMQLFFSAFHLENMTYFIGLCMVIGGLGIASSWMLGLAKSLHIALSSSPVTIGTLKKLNRHQVPIGVLWFQAAIYTAIMLVFLFFPNLNRSYWILSATTAQFALLYYIIVFCAAMKLLRMKSTTMLNIAFPIMAMFLCTTGLLAGFIPPILH